MTHEDIESLSTAINSLKDDGNDGHKLYVITELLFCIAKDLSRLSNKLSSIEEIYRGTIY